MGGSCQAGCGVIRNGWRDAGSGTRGFPAGGAQTSHSNEVFGEGDVVMKIKEIRDLGTDELKRKNLDLVDDLFRLRIRHTSGQLETSSSLGRVKKDIARIKTVLRQREAH
jgi:large subunit ribosomal protein L29